MKRRVYIPFSSRQQIGGPASFMRNLKAQLDQDDYRLANSPYGAKAIFFPVTTSERKIRWVKALGGKVIQRLDGIHYGWYPPGTPDPNEAVRNIYQEFADHVVFQSEFSRDQVFSILGEIPEASYSIICNGADTSLFFPNQDKSASETMYFATSGNFRHRLMVWPVVEAFDALRKQGFDLRLNLIGPLNLKDPEDKQSLLSRDYINQVSFDTPGPLGEYLREQNDAFIYTHYNSACPNAVIEAICCGLPVVGYDSGAMSELCHFSEELLAPVSDELIHDRKHYSVDALILALKNYLAQPEHYRKVALEHTEDYSMTACGRQYQALFDRIQPTPFSKALLGRTQ